MKRKYREAAHAKQRLQDAYIDGMTDDQAAIEARDCHDEHVPDYPVAPADHHLDQQLPF